MEQTQCHHPKTLRLQLHPTLQFIRGNVVDVNGLLHPGVGVGGPASDVAHQLVVLTWRRQFGSLKRNTVDLGINTATFGIILGSAVGFVQIRYLFQQGTLFFPIQGPHFAGTLKEHVLHVMRQTGGFWRVLFRACSYHDIGEHPWFIFIYTQEQLQAIRQGIALHFQ